MRLYERFAIATGRKLGNEQHDADEQTARPKEHAVQIPVRTAA